MSDVTIETEKPAAKGGDERLAHRGVFQRMLVRPEIGAVIGALGIWTFFWAVAERFGNYGGASNILEVSSILGIMSVAVAMLMIGGEFDLSSGAATGALGIVIILLVHDVTGAQGGLSLNLWIALPLSLGIALLLGWFNGSMVERTSLPSFIVTLGSFFMLKGLKLGFSKLIVDQIQVGKLNDLITEKVRVNIDGVPTTTTVYTDTFKLLESGTPVSELPEGSLGVSDRGYEFFNKVFAAEWQRLDHLWESRDLVYTIAILGGLSLLVLAIYEQNFKRRAHQNPLGLAVFVAGIAAGIAGVLILHNTDDTNGNWLGALVIGAAMVIGFFGFSMWRFEPVSDRGSFTFDAGVTRAIGIGVVLTAVGVFFAAQLDAYSERTVATMIEENFSTALPAIVVVGLGLLGIAFALFRAPVTLLAKVLLLGLAIIFTVGLAYFVTEQGLRAILFVGIGVAGLGWLSISVNRAGRKSVMSKSALLMLTAAVIAGLAFFIQSESVSPKFRTEVFSVMLALAGLMVAWAVVTLFFAVRREPDASAERLGSILNWSGMAALALGLIVRLMFTTEAEVLAGNPPAKYTVRILWFLGFTAACSWVLARTKFGSWVFAVGGNKQAARQVGVPAARTKTQLFMLVSGAAWLVGVLLAFNLNTIQASTGNGLEFEYIIAAVVGGTMLTGGYGSTIGAAIGAVIMAMAVQGIPFSRWNSDWRFLFLGVILLLAVIANNFIKTKAEGIRT